MTTETLIIGAFCALSCAGGVLIGYAQALRTIRAAVRKAKDDTWRIVEEHQLQALQRKAAPPDPESSAGPVRTQYPAFPPHVFRPLT